MKKTLKHICCFLILLLLLILAACKVSSETITSQSKNIAEEKISAETTDPVIDKLNEIMDINLKNEIEKKKLTEQNLKTDQEKLAFIDSELKYYEAKSFGE